jgi:hypothetical protein
MNPVVEPAATAPIPAYGYAADVLVVLHFLFMAFIVFGQLAIIIAAGFKWQWGRNPWFRYIHLACILFVVYEAIIQYECPLTTLERHWRGLAGQQMGEGSTFIGHYAHKWLFWDDKTTLDVIFACTICFGIIVIQGIVMYPPRWFRKQSGTPLPSGERGRGEGRDYLRPNTPAMAEKNVAISSGSAPRP